MSEEVYDEKIAPALRAVAEICKEHDLPFVAVCEFEPGSLAHVRLPGVATFASLLADMAASACGNFNNLVLGVLQWCKSEGDCSQSLFVARFAGKEK